MKRAEQCWWHGHVGLCTFVYRRNLQLQGITSITHQRPQLVIPIDELSAVSHRKRDNCTVTKVTNKILNSSAQHCARHEADQVSVTLPYTNTALASPSFPSIPTHPGSSALIDCRSEGSPTAECFSQNRARLWTGKESTKRCRRTSFMQHYSRMTAD